MKIRTERNGTEGAVKKALTPAVLSVKRLTKLTKIEQFDTSKLINTDEMDEFPEAHKLLVAELPPEEKGSLSRPVMSK